MQVLNEHRIDSENRVYTADIELAQGERIEIRFQCHFDFPPQVFISNASDEDKKLIDWETTVFSANIKNIGQRTVRFSVRIRQVKINPYALKATKANCRDFFLYGWDRDLLE